MKLAIKNCLNKKMKYLMSYHKIRTIINSKCLNMRLELDLLRNQ